MLCYNNPMPLFSSKSHSLELIIDIESDAVRVTAVLYRTGAAPFVIYTAQKNVIRKSQTDGAYLTRMMFRTLDDAARAASLALPLALKKAEVGQSGIDAIHFVLSSPWIIPRLVRAKETFKKKTRIKSRHVTALVEKEKRAASAMFGADSVAVDAKLFEVAADGHPVDSYQGLRAQSLEGNLAIALGSRAIMAEIKSIVNRSFRGSRESFHSAGFLRSAALRSILPRTDGMPAETAYAWLETHGELTDIVVAGTGGHTLYGSLPFGSETLVRAMAKATGGSEESARSSLNLLFAGNTSEAVVHGHQAASDEILREWVEGSLGIISGKGGTAAMPAIWVSAEHHGSAFVSALRKSRPPVVVRTADARLAAPFVGYAPGAMPDLASSLYAAALPLSRRV
jgi:hypothetical protein